MYEVVIIGGGPAGCAAAVYSARKKMKTVLLTKDFGGQSVVSDDIGNWIGDISISGVELAKRFENHVRAQEDIDVHDGEIVESIKKTEDGDFPTYEVKTDKSVYQTKAIILASGGRRRKLGVPGEKEYDGKGVVYCSTCDAPLFRGRDVVVIGGGNSGLEAVVDLFPYAEKITLLVRGEELKGDPTTQESVKNSDKVTVIYKADTKEVIGEAMVTGLKYEDLDSGEMKELKVGGVFVEIGSIPNSEIVADLVELNERKEVVIDHQLFTTSQKGVFAAGDVTDERFKQNNISAGDAVAATLSTYEYIKSYRKHTGQM